MRKRFFCSIIVVMIATIAAFNVYKNYSNEAGLSDILLSNVEALASNEGFSSSANCFTYCRISTQYNCTIYQYGWYVEKCYYFRG